MNAVALLALWYVNGAAMPTEPDESRAVQTLRFDQAMRLLPGERFTLFRLLRWQSATQADAGDVRQKGTPPWRH